MVRHDGDDDDDDDVNKYRHDLGFEVHNVTGSATSGTQ